MKPYQTAQFLTKMDDQKDLDRYFEVMFAHIRLLMDIPEVDQDICRQYFKPAFVKKGQILAESGTVHRHHNFIVSGYMRNCYLNEEGQEVTTDINDGPRFLTSFNHFIHGTVSNENIHCITDCELLRIDRDDMETSAKLSTTQMDYSMKVLHLQLEKDKQRAIALTTLSAEQRYLKLLNESPLIVQNIPLKYIASYLGINPGSLSRIRKEID